MKYLILFSTVLAFPALADEACVATKAPNGNYLTYQGCSPEPLLTGGYIVTIEVVGDKTFEVTREARGHAEVGRKEI